MIFMVSDLKNFIVFLHGLSGSGKGEIQRKLAENYSSHGYDTVYVSSGALFRAALSDPVLAEQVRRGYFLDTLGAIMPGIEKVSEHFIKRWAESDGKTIMILDGLIRRGAFEGKDGLLVPSQVEQISVGLNNVIRKLILEDENLARHFPEYTNTGYENEQEQIGIVSQTLKNSHHIVADVLPQDAEAQMRRRADKEIMSIRFQLHDRFTDGRINQGEMQKIEDCVSRLEGVLHGGFRKDGDTLTYTPRVEWDDQIDTSLYPMAAAEVKRTKETIAKTLGLVNSTSLTASFESVGVFTELRDDDISPIGRSARIDNYIKIDEREGNLQYEAGFATQALCEDLGFRFNPNGSFSSESRNCIVIANGQSRGIGLEQFQGKCEFMAQRLFGETESRREIIFGSKEGQRINHERER